MKKKLCIGFGIYFILNFLMCIFIFFSEESNPGYLVGGAIALLIGCLLIKKAKKVENSVSGHEKTDEIINIKEIEVDSQPAVVKTLKQNSQVLKSLSEETDNTVILDAFTSFSVDNTSKVFYVLKDRKLYKFSFNKITDYEYKENGNVIISGKTGATLVGAATFGVVGAMVGASGKRKQKEIVNSNLLIYLNDLKTPCLDISIAKNLKKDSSKYKTTINNLNEIIGCIKYILNNK